METEAEVEIKTTAKKGKCLYLRNPRKYGELVYSEIPLFHSKASTDGLFELVKQTMANVDADLAFHWYAAAVMSLLSENDEAKNVLVNKWHPDDQELKLCEEIVKRLSPFVDKEMRSRLNSQALKKHLLVWRFNSFSHYSDDKSLVMYNVTSFMAHSCRPSAAWAFGENDAFNLRSIRKLDAEAELTISYLSEEQLVMTNLQRREILQGWLFRCECERCVESFDPFRIIKCPHCSYGSLSLPTDPTITASCSICHHCLSADSLVEYATAEEKYVGRIAAMTADDTEEAEQLYEYALHVFWDHWILHKLESILLPFYKRTDSAEKQRLYLRLLDRKIKYFEKLLFPTYTLAWAYEELADVLQSKELYERAYHVMRAVAGDDSGYTTSICSKWRDLNKQP